MPNHVSHKLTIRDSTTSSKTYEKMCNLMKTERGKFDFNALIPYPQEFKDLDSKRELAEKSGVPWSELPKDGYNQGGYDWCCENWGTKWNAYTVRVEYGEVTFQTAWSFPEPIIHELTRKFPKEMFDIEYADEDYGSNCAIVAWKNGKEIERKDPTTCNYINWELFAKALYFKVELNSERVENRELRKMLKKYEEGVNHE